ncbi:InlB B-repeat-containing protein, partial [Acholeplasma laidlawii]|uniref:InlB B-repeat-containing protein n=1 Tax=Acholeplasma laidlawii TaxID=2148 RepID=UPI001177FCF5
MKKLTIIVTFLVTLLLVTPFVFASSGAPTMIEGASIRTSGEQGLRFYANLENEAVTSQGFYLVYGETSVVNLQTAISNAVEDNVMLNGKKVFKVEVENREPNGDFSVVLTGIPEVGYLDKITAIAYGVVDNAEIFVSAGTTRSIGEVAYNMIKANDYNQVALDILESIDINHRALVSTHWETYEESSAIFETDPLILKTQFINDWNAKFGTTLTDLIGTAFHTSAIVGKTDQAAQGSMTNLTGMRIYAFFKDELYSLKWGWLLDYIIKYGSGIIHPARQAVALKGDGTNNNQILYDASHFNYSLVNFFNMSNQAGGFAPIDFTLPGSKARYQDVVNFNKTIPTTLSIYNLSKIGDSVALPQDLTKNGYTFNQSFTDGTNAYTTSYILTGESKILTPNFTAITYDINFFDGVDELDLSVNNYNVNQNVTLPSYSKEGYVFEGWYDNAEFIGSPIINIASGNTGNKTFFAKMVASEFVQVEVTINLEGGLLSS